MKEEIFVGPANQHIQDLFNSLKIPRDYLYGYDSASYRLSVSERKHNDSDTIIEKKHDSKK